MTHVTNYSKNTRRCMLSLHSRSLKNACHCVEAQVAVFSSFIKMKISRTCSSCEKVISFPSPSLSLSLCSPNIHGATRVNSFLLSKKKISAIRCKKMYIASNLYHEEKEEEEGKLTFEERIFI